MEKAFVFSQNQKDLIWTRFVEPAGGTKEEFLLFLEVCESAGLSPLLKEIRFEKQEGMPASFLPTREGLLRTAASHPDFIGMPCAAEVREGDVFQMYAGEGNVRHAFGQRRGKLRGAYAVLGHKRFRSCAVFVSVEQMMKAKGMLDEYFEKGVAAEKMVSADMVIRAAETAVLRRQFPIRGFFAAEDIGIDVVFNHQTHTIKPNRDPLFPLSFLDEEKREAAEESEGNSLDVPEPDTLKENGLKKVMLKRYQPGVSPSGIPYAKLIVVEQDSQQEKLVLAKGEEAIELTKLIPEEEVFQIGIRTEKGHLFLQSVNQKEAGEAI